MGLERVAEDLPDGEIILYHPQLTGLHARHVEQILYETVHAGGGALNPLRRLSFALGDASEDEACLHQNRAERTTQVMRDDTENVVSVLNRALRRAVETSVLHRQRRTLGDLVR